MQLAQSTARYYGGIADKIVGQTIPAGTRHVTQTVSKLLNGRFKIYKTARNNLGTGRVATPGGRPSRSHTQSFTVSARCAYSFAVYVLLDVLLLFNAQ